MRRLIDYEINWHVVCDETLKIAYLPIPKIANTSILHTIFEMLPEYKKIERMEKVRASNPPVKFNSPGIVHFRTNIMFDKIMDRSLDLSEYFIFSCVRHPVTRFISFYRDKILRWDPFIEDELHKLGFHKEMPLEECVEILIKHHPSKLEQHIRPIAMFLYYGGKLKVDYFFKFEEMAKGWRYIKKITGLQMNHHQNPSDRQGIKSVELNEYYANKLKSFYEEDMLLFGYE